MQIQVNTDNHTEGGADLTAKVEALIQDKLKRFSAQITRVEVQLSDQNSEAKSGPDDIRCVIEARLAGMQPMTVSDQSSSQEQALRGAVGKMERMIDSTLGKLGRR